MVFTSRYFLIIAYVFIIIAINSFGALYKNVQTQYSNVELYKNYTNTCTPTTNTSQKYIISITTIPSRVKHIQDTVNSLLNQSPKPYKIVVNIPKKYKRFPHETCKIPLFLKNNERIIINEIDIDYGPATKLLGLKNIDIVHNKEVSAILITDDDMKKSNTWAFELLSRMNNVDEVYQLMITKNKYMDFKIYGYKGFGLYSSYLPE